ncbi:MAG TPA: glycosyltransferase family 87 protein [Streptosporangiaceae bacterium]|nr:glycosyltransferase family 87 protein [Streptosporangiaceae bacterium]
MSGAIARPTASEQPGGRQSDAGAVPPAGRPGWLTPVNAAIAICTVLGLGLRLLLLSRPGYLTGVTEYDDGPYFGSAVDLVHGLLPYRGFILVQPPGITLLMLPAALLSKVTGTATAMAAGRLLTTLASTAGIFLVGLLIRHRGTLAVIVACGIVAVYPDGVLTARTVLVEPWLVLFCLIGALALFDADRLTGSGKRLFWGGVAFGFAGAVEVWAIFPVVVLAVMLLPQVRRLGVFAGGVAAGFLVPVLPFAAAAPKRFYQSLYVAQVAPRAGSTRVPLGARLSNMLGIVNIHLPAHPLLVIDLATLVLVAVVAAAIAAAWRISHRPPPALDWFALVACVVVVVMFLWPDQFHYHFTAFLVPFFGLSLALPAARLLEVAGKGTAWLPAAEAQRLWKPATAVAALAIAVLVMDQGSFESHLRLPLGPVAPVVDRIIPRGACVATDQVSYLLMANRFFSDVPGCPRMLDGLGSDLAFSNGLKPGTGAGNVPAVEALWRSEFDHAQYVWLSYNAYRRVAWTPQLRAYFAANFVRVYKHAWHDTVYARKGLHAG